MAQGRKTGGRQPGSVNRRTANLLAQTESEGITPLTYMLTTLRDEDADPKDRQWAADKAAQYLHPRPVPQSRPIEINLPDTSTPAGIAAAISAVLAATAKGRLAPSEARDLVGLLEARLKALEAVDLEERIARLETAQNGGK